MIVDKNDNNSSGQFRPSNSSLSQHVSPDWKKISVSTWQQMLLQLSDTEIAPKDRLYWMLICRDWLNVNCGDDMAVDDAQSVCLSLMNQLAYRLCDWPLIIAIYQQMAAKLPKFSLQKLDEQAMVDTLHCAVAYWQLGQLTTAEQFLHSKLALLPSDSPLHQFHQQILHDIARKPLYLVSPDNPALSLSPLEEQHLSSFSWVYQDTQIAKLCNLPEFNSDEQWFQWLDADQVNENKQVFAVNHRHWGFIGVVSIEVHQGVGFFYYWLGQDFQGGGLGPLAVKLLLEMAKKHLHMRCCYAKVFKNNVASQKAMGKLDFKPVPFMLAAPNDDQMYFYCGEPKARQHWWQELVALAAITDIDSQILP